jgi:hypothetical protein
VIFGTTVKLRVENLVDEQNGKEEQTYEITSIGASIRTKQEAIITCYKEMKSVSNTP